MGSERRRALRSRPPQGQRHAVKLYGTPKGEQQAWLWDLSSVGAGCLVPRDAAAGLFLGLFCELVTNLADGQELRCPVIVRQLRPMAAGFHVGLELLIDDPIHAPARAAIERTVEHWLRQAYAGASESDQSTAA